MYKEFFTYTTNKDLQGDVSKWQALQIEFNGTKTCRFVLHDNDEDSDLYPDNLDIKHVAIELDRENAIEIARAILFSLNAL